MNRLLIVGCGDVMRRALPGLLHRWRVYALVRRPDPVLAAWGVVQIVGDLDQAVTLRRLAGLADAVVHSAPPANDDSNEDHRTRRLIAALRRRGSLPRRLIYIGTSGVYGDCRGERVPEVRPAAPRSGRARRRHSAEILLRRFNAASGCSVSLLRAPGIYAADRLPLERLRRGLPLLSPGEDVYTNHIHADDLAAACIAALRHGRSCRAYNASDDSELKMGEWFDTLADAFALPRAPRATPAEVDAALSPMQRSFMGESRRLCNRRLKAELRLRLRYPTTAEGIAAALVGKGST
ncbi:MAG: NAD-dependent epimerase/dehydratase family protein [Proteobacteria bacterium]|nr:NAD-dependent epimerase/dehydratase family protein [Pseudomonadota bacterium]HQR04868.1 NAD-dependent epimerase/dehydratase family protein [Rhodocyclaceae bacterium]